MFVLQTLLQLVVNLMLCVYGLNFHQHKYVIISDDFKVDSINNTALDILTGVVKNNAEINVLNITINVKIPLPQNTKFAIKAFKLVNDQYRDSIIQFEKSLQDAFEMEMFDLQSLWVEHARPPIVWPLQVGVTYRTFGWNPDSTKYPPNLPIGKYKVHIAIGVPHHPHLVVLYWFARTVSNSHD